MASKNVAEVVIAGRVLKITGFESSEYLHQIAGYINDKISEFEQMESYRRQSSDEKQILIYMNLADDYFRSKRQADKQKKELDKRDKEMYSLKHDLIESQMARENLEKEVKEKLDKQKKDSKEKLEKQEQEFAEKLESMEQEAKEKLEEQKRKAKEELDSLQEEIQKLKQQISRLETEGKNRSSRNYNNRSNGGYQGGFN